MSLISIKNFTKKFKDFVAVNNATFDINKGTIHGFIGPNGSGKTTTIKTMIGAYLDDSKSIKISNFPSGSVEANKLIGYIPERAAFPSHLNTYQYLEQMARISGLDKNEAKSVIETKLNELGLWDQRKRNPNKFSSGMQKKIMLIQALLTNPEVLILDEPAANLDPIARKELFDILLELRKHNKTIFISSHILSELERIVDSVTFIYYGNVQYSGSVSKLINDKSDVYIKSNKNNELIKLLNNYNFKAKLNLNDEVVISNVSSRVKEYIIPLLVENNIEIESFRSSDLTTIYNEFVAKEKRKQNADI